MEFTAKLADTPVCFRVVYPSTRSYLRNYLSDEEPTLFLSISQDDIDRERAISARTRAAEGLPPLQSSDAYLERLAVYRKLAEQMIRRDVLLFHGSVIAVDGEAYLFAAKSGTGKSTHARLWREAFGDRAVMINDDKPLLHIGEDRVLAFGTPWSGKHRLNSNRSVPLKAYCVLERDSSNHIEAISPEDAFSSLFLQCFRPEDEQSTELVLSLLERMSRAVKFYHLGCNMDPEAALVSYRGMQEENP